MKLHFSLMAGVVVLFFVGAAKADTIPPVDPRITVGHVVGSTAVDTTTFTIKLVGEGNNKFGGDFDYFNNTGLAWSELIFTGRSKDPQAVTCLTDNSSIFSQCSVQSSVIGNGSGKMSEVTIVYFGGDLVPGEHFFVDFGAKGDTDLWQSPFITAQAITGVAEPSTFALLMGGLLLLPVLVLTKSRI